MKIYHQPTFHHSLHIILSHTLHSHSTGVGKCPFIIFGDFEHHLQVFVQLGHLPTPALYGQLPIFLQKNIQKSNGPMISHMTSEHGREIIHKSRFSAAKITRGYPTSMPTDKIQPIILGA
jgi:hypothetical protein